MTDNTKPSPYIVNKGQKRFNATAPYSVFAVRAASKFMPAVSPAAYNLARYLSTYYNNNSANGVVNPSEPRIKYALCLSDEEFAVAVEELEASGWFSASRTDSGRIEQYNLKFVPYMYENFDALDAINSSLNHAKFDARYTRTQNQLAKAIMGLATESIEPLYEDLGYQKARDERRDPPHMVPNGDKFAKLCHAVFFHHPMIHTGDPEVWAELAAMDTLPEDWTTHTMSTRLSFRDISEKFLLADDYDAVYEAVEAISEGGWWRAEIKSSPFDSADDVLLMTPTYKFHAAVWELDNAAGGKNTTAWEVANGFHQENFAAGITGDSFYCLPDLGYHYIYAISSYKTRERIIVGQTTQTLEHRKNQHFYSGTNDEANAELEAIAKDDDDFLVIEHLETVHKWICSKREMAIANEMIAMGHPLKNVILTEDRNFKTIKPDRRLTQVPWKGITPEEKARLTAIQKAELKKCLDDHDGKRIIWKIDALPPVPAHVQREEPLESVSEGKASVWGTYDMDNPFIPWEVDEDAETVPTVTTVAPTEISTVNNLEADEQAEQEQTPDEAKSDSREAIAMPFLEYRTVQPVQAVPAPRLREERSATVDAIPFPDIWQRSPRTQKAS